MTLNLLTVSAKSRYAVVGLVELAGREQAAPGRPVRLADLAAARSIPEQFLVQVFAELRRAGVVASRRGAAGGYTLARPGEHLTVLEVMQALDGSSPLSRCTGGERGSPEAEGVSSVWLEAQEALESVLAQTTIAALYEREQRALKTVMYHI